MKRFVTIFASIIYVGAVLLLAFNYGWTARTKISLVAVEGALCIARRGFLSVPLIGHFSSSTHWVAWAIVLSVGLPVLAIALWKRWRQPERIFVWRAVICLTVASIITPIWVSEGFGDVFVESNFPSVAVVPSELLSILLARRGSLPESITRRSRIATHLYQVQVYIVDKADSMSD